tara:strand:+ start:6998 stop:7162 length:165 start_codon:yes stop_codon:yes gene_type:complete
MQVKSQANTPLPDSHAQFFYDQRHTSAQALPSKQLVTRIRLSTAAQFLKPPPNL